MGAQKAQKTQTTSVGDVFVTQSTSMAIFSQIQENCSLERVKMGQNWQSYAFLARKMRIIVGAQISLIHLCHFRCSSHVCCEIESNPAKACSFCSVP